MVRVRYARVPVPIRFYTLHSRRLPRPFANFRRPDSRGAGRAREQISPLSETTSWNSRYSRPKIGARAKRPRDLGARGLEQDERRGARCRRRRTGRKEVGKMVVANRRGGQGGRGGRGGRREELGRAVPEEGGGQKRSISAAHATVCSTAGPDRPLMPISTYQISIITRYGGKNAINVYIRGARM